MIRYSGAILGFSALLTAAWAAVPIEKSGDCPKLERQPADPNDNWGQFIIKPTSEFVTNCTSGNPSGCTLQKPLTPAQSINCIVPAEGLKVQLWASEEMAGNMKYIQHFSFDEKGRLWAVEPASYPNTIRAAGGSITDQKFTGGKDRIVILEDTDGDHVMDKFKVFRDGLNLPQSIECVNGGVVVGMTPYVAYFPNNGDTAGTPVILYQGMGSSGNAWDTHGGINQLMYGLDNWIYGSTGYNACNATGPGITGSVDCGKSKVWRFRHTGIPGMKENKFEIWSTGFSPSQNSDGLGQMEDGQLFQAGATSSQHLYFQPVKGGAGVNVLAKNPASGSATYGENDYFPVTNDRYLWEGGNGKNAQGWILSSNTATSGVQFYTSRLFPKKYWNRAVFTCEGASKLCNMDSLGESGSGWKAYRLPGPTRSNLIASTDAWVAPVLAKTGPDGAVWVLDWNNYLFLHNPASPGGSCSGGIPNNGCAWNNKLREKSTNRIYRVLPADAAPEAVLNLSNAGEDQLIATFANPNFFWRLAAQRILIGKGATPTVAAKLKDILASDRSVDEVGNSPRVQHAMWTLEGLGQFSADPPTWVPVLAKLLQHPAWCVRRNALRAMPRTAEGASAINEACSVNDDHGHVRLQALLALGEIANKPAGLKAIWSQYANVDATASAAVTGSGVPASSTKPCMVAVSIGSSFRPETGTAPRPGLRFQMQSGGFRLLAHGGLPSGALSVYDLKGRQVFASRYEAGRGAWSVAAAEGLHEPMYLYDFRGTDGVPRRGRLALLGAR